MKHHDSYLNNIGNLQLKRLPKKGVAALANIFNSCLAFQYYPLQRKHAIIIPIPKAGKPRKDITSYRPVSLLQTSENFSSESSRHAYFKNEDTLLAEQFGFRSGHSTTHKLYRLTDHIRHNFNIGKHTGLICLDLQQAFDKVWHRGLVY